MPSHHTAKSGKGFIDAIIGLVVIIAGIWLAFFLISLVLRIIVLVIVAAVAIWVLTRLIAGAKKIGSG